MPVTFDTETIQLITLFENITHTQVKDCLTDGNKTVYFVVQGNIGKAVGKNGVSVKNTERLIRRDVRIVEFSDDLERFVKNLIPQTNSIKMTNENNRIILEIWIDRNSKPIVIGRDGKNLKVYKELLQRSHDISDVIIR